ncbi:recombination endonuclease VII [Vibrio phage vB_VhaP_VH-5]|uniref:Recombination endonuclease VII n=1 Tax=Vibrio phage vB_VhaP_VH-5 TaxID=2660694 RepID=A0A5Q2WC15_9CAUD|nr:recombination endonuclease VII [Vibrio phage vB_VhaP_VH-5]
MKSLAKITRSQQYSITMQLLKRQDMKCLVCGQPINVTTKGRSSDYALDHAHSTGEVRGVLHRSCNSAEGKVRHAVSRWGAKSSEETAVVEYLEGLTKYLRECLDGVRTTGLMYPNHKTPEEKAAAAKLKRRKKYAENKAKASMKQRKEQK